MSDELTRALAEAVIEEDVLDHHQWCESNYTSGCNCLSSRETTATKIAAALAPVIEARVREARAEEVRSLIRQLEGGDGDEFDTYLAESLKKPLVLQGFLGGRLAFLSAEEVRGG